MMRIKRISLLVIKRKQRHCLFNWNLNLDNNDYLLFLLIRLILDGISQHCNGATPHLKLERIVITDRLMATDGMQLSVKSLPHGATLPSQFALGKFALSTVPETTDRYKNLVRKIKSDWLRPEPFSIQSKWIKVRIKFALNFSVFIDLFSPL